MPTGARNGIFTERPRETVGELVGEASRLQVANLQRENTVSSPLLYVSACRRDNKDKIECRPSDCHFSRGELSRARAIRSGPPSCPYSPKCLEGEFCELRELGVLGSLLGIGSPRVR